ncbi:MAG: hypothetical protein OYK82_08820 [Gammaproteobacteria bacterium]|nr:hypothetical protein [Gammaproteobacteria bacterium]
MPGRKRAVARGPATPMARTLPVRSRRRRLEDAAHVTDGGIFAALTERPLDADPLVEPAGPAWYSVGAGQMAAPVPAPER